MRIKYWCSTTSSLIYELYELQPLKIDILRKFGAFNIKVCVAFTGKQYPAESLNKIQANVREDRADRAQLLL